MSHNPPNRDHNATSTSATASASASASASAPAPAPVAWAFGAAYGQPLPPSFQFNPQTGFTALSNYTVATSQGQPADQLPRVNPHIATYPNGPNKASWTGMTSLSAEEKADYGRGATISSAVKGWRAGGSIGVVTSSMSDAAKQSQNQNDWHTVAMARNGSEVWVHDPEYKPAEHAGKVKRVDGVKGTGNVHRLIQQWPNVQGVYFQGPPSSYTEQPGQMECMGRSAQWVDATVNGTLPWPPNHDASGGQWTFHYRN